MSNTPVFDIDRMEFLKDSYPFLERMRASCPVAYVPALDAVFITKLDDVVTLENKIDIFSSNQPDGFNGAKYDVKGWRCSSKGAQSDLS